MLWKGKAPEKMETERHTSTPPGSLPHPPSSPDLFPWQPSTRCCSIQRESQSCTSSGTRGCLQLPETHGRMDRHTHTWGDGARQTETETKTWGDPGPEMPGLQAARRRQTDTQGETEADRHSGRRRETCGETGKEKTGGMEARGRQGVGGWKEDKTGLRLGR